MQLLIILSLLVYQPLFARSGPLESLCGENDLVQINQFSGDDNFPLDLVKVRKKAVGVIIRNGWKRFCTGTMISDRLMLTARHCIDYKRPSSLTVAFNYEVDSAGNSQNEKIYNVEEFVEKGGSERLDYAIIKLSDKPGLYHGQTVLAKSRSSSERKLVKDGDPILLIQHPDGMPKQLDVGTIKKSEGNYLQYDDLDTLGGSSGAGLLNKRGKLIGVHVLGGCYKVGGTNKAISIESIRRSSEILLDLDL